MGRRKIKKQNLPVVKNESNIMSQEQMIEMHAEAYYRALKRIDDEKSKDDQQKSEKRKYKWYEEILFCLNIFLWPWKLTKDLVLTIGSTIAYRFYLFQVFYDLLAD